ncbi:MAG: hypothetical protein HZB86_00720 [Deltaproteobacteria bacterium]|nr:hypothetical protein [Deltaproteobacteria bacterium]
MKATPACEARTAEICSWVTKPRLMRISPTRSPVRFCSRRARSSWSWVTRPASISLSPSIFRFGGLCSPGLRPVPPLTGRSPGAG